MDRTYWTTQVVMLVAAIAVALLWGAVGRMDYDDQMQQEAEYCRMVTAGSWPAYNPDVDCSKRE